MYFYLWCKKFVSNDSYCRMVKLHVMLTLYIQTHNALTLQHIFIIFQLFIFIFLVVKFKQVVETKQIYFKIFTFLCRVNCALDSLPADEADISCQVPHVKCPAIGFGTCIFKWPVTCLVTYVLAHELSHALSHMLLNVRCLIPCHLCSHISC